MLEMMGFHVTQLVDAVDDRSLKLGTTSRTGPHAVRVIAGFRSEAGRSFHGRWITNEEIWCLNSIYDIILAPDALQVLNVVNGDSTTTRFSKDLHYPMEVVTLSKIERFV